MSAALATPISTAVTRRPTSTPPPIVSMASRSGVPIGISATPARFVEPLTVHTIVPGDSLGAERAEPVGAVGDDPGHVGDRLDVVDQRRRGLGLPGHQHRGGEPALARRVVDVLDDLGGAAPPRRGDARERRTAGDRLEQGGLLAVEVLPWPLEDGEDAAIDPPGRLHLGDGPLDPLDLADERRLEGDHRRRRADRPGRDHGTLEHGVGVGPQDRPVLERPRLALRAVDDDRRRQRRRMPARRPSTT